MQRRLFPFYRIMGQSGRTNPVCLLKEALKLYGVDAGLPRLPLSRGTDDEIKNIKIVMEDLNLI